MQGNAVHDYVFPVVEFSYSRSGHAVLDRFRGTGFFAGPGRGVTARVNTQDSTSHLAILLVDLDKRWSAFSVSKVRECASCDVALLTILPPDGVTRWRSFASAADTEKIRAGTQYSLWGYTDEIDQARGQLIRNLRYNPVRVDGSMTSRMDGSVAGYRGTTLFQTNHADLAGLTGAPLFVGRADAEPEVSAVYLGASIGDTIQGVVAYACPISCVTEWGPSSTNRRLPGPDTGATGVLSGT